MKKYSKITKNSYKNKRKLIKIKKITKRQYGGFKLLRQKEKNITNISRYKLGSVPKRMSLLPNTQINAQKRTHRIAKIRGDIRSLNKNNIRQKKLSKNKKNKNNNRKLQKLHEKLKMLKMNRTDMQS